jgi:hypothetical protein
VKDSVPPDIISGPWTALTQQSLLETAIAFTVGQTNSMNDAVTAQRIAKPTKTCFFFVIFNLLWLAIVVGEPGI